MALVVKFYSFNDGLFVGTLLAMTMFTIRYSGSQAGVRSCGDARHLHLVAGGDPFCHGQTCFFLNLDDWISNL